jgi:large subunit ribosomal protein L18
MSKISGNKEKPRLAVFRSSKNIYAQIINDFDGIVIVGVSTLNPDIKNKKLSNPKERAREVGKAIAKKALEKDIKKVVFDRKNYKYHGSVKELADGAREGGLEF